MVTSEKFWDKTARKYAASPISDMVSYEKTMAQTRTHLSVEDCVLEAGCGTGSTALLLAGNVAHITAIDSSGGMIEIANEKIADKRVENVYFLQTVLEDETLEDGAYDTVLAFNFLHLHEDLIHAVSDIRRLLKPGGTFISKTVCLGGGFSLWRLVLPVMRLIGMAPPVNFLSQEKLEDTFTAGGFEIVETHTYPGTITTHFIVARKV